ncbi:hypothetical protein L1987_26576 [Smallanthus sonchifolius]|uniref:Uncharacterized protein n=1 Tax=Smallanthus sonchifolius TaxID=185202 RepID=A0ACB9I961_9ASTR|nr:hypothetical protein L1987_26576 [Smallanthus sonchifolius]
MAEPVNEPSPTHSADPEPPKHHAEKSANKRKPTSSAAASPPSKRPVTSSPSNEDKADDSKSKKEDDVIEVDLPDIVVMSDLIEYRRVKGVYPFEDSKHMRIFCSKWIRLGFGNAGGWKAKIEQLKNKFKNHSGRFEPGERGEFMMWKMIFGNQGN